MIARAVLLVLVGLAMPLRAQATPFGSILYAPDKAWTWALRQWPALAELDRTEERSAGMTGLVVEAGGYALARVTPMSFRRGRQVVAGVYVLRAAYGLASGETRRRRAHAKHVGVAVSVAVLRIHVRVRL